MTKQPKVSVLVPCYNVEKYLRQCMDSIISQTLKDIEIICINDGSTDSTLAILQDYAQKDSRVKIIDKPNSGYGASMNLGLKAASGEYIGIVESDDWVEPEMFTDLYALAVQNGVDVIKGNYYRYWSKPDEKNELVTSMPEKDLNKVICPIVARDIFLSAPAIWSAIYRRKFIEKNGIGFLETPGASYQDTSFNFKVWATAKKVYLTDKAYLHYRQDNENSSIHSPKKIYCVCDEYGEIEKFSKERNLFEKLKYLICRLKFSTYFWNFERLCFPLNWQFLKSFSQEFALADQHQLIDKNLFGKKLYKKAHKLACNKYLFFVSYYFRKIRKLSLFAPNKRRKLFNKSVVKHFLLSFKRYRIKGKNNKVIIISNGEKILFNKYQVLKGLSIEIEGNNNTIEIELPLPRLQNSKCEVKGNNNFIRIGRSPYPIKLVLNLGWTVNNRKIIIGKDFSCTSARLLINEDNASLFIGENCMFSRGIIIRTDGHTIIDKKTGHILNNIADMYIGNHVWVGENVAILKNTKISDNSIIGLGSIVTKKICEPNVVIAGNPAKIIKKDISWDRENASIYKRTYLEKSNA